MSTISKKGIVEKHFYLILKSYFGDKVFINKGLSDTVNLPYIPDFVFFDDDNNLHIDIEIDEPYRIETGEPTHFNYAIYKHDIWDVLCVDQKRDNFFTRRGWFILKFSEEQVFKYPKSCCKLISELLKSVFNDTSYSKIFSQIEDIKPVSAFSIKDCILLERKRYRENYLGLKVNRHNFIVNTHIEELIENYNKFEAFESEHDYGY